jgi:hypothetical protein
MKKVLLAVLVSVSFGVSAADKPDPHEICSNGEELARTIMKSRQIGVSLSSIMAIAKEQGAESVKHIALMAYDKPRYSTEEMQQRSIEDFANEVYLSCLKGSKQ